MADLLRQIVDRYISSMEEATQKRLELAKEELRIAQFENKLFNEFRQDIYTLPLREKEEKKTWSGEKLC